MKKVPGEVFVSEFESGEGSRRVVWAAWSPTGARTNEKDHYTPRETRVALTDLPAPVVKVVGMATTEREAPEPPWEKTGPAAITLTVGESPIYVIMERKPD